MSQKVSGYTSRSNGGCLYQRTAGFLTGKYQASQRLVGFPVKDVVVGFPAGGSQDESTPH